MEFILKIFYFLDVLQNVFSKLDKSPNLFKNVMQIISFPMFLLFFLTNSILFWRKIPIFHLISTYFIPHFISTIVYANF